MTIPQENAARIAVAKSESGRGDLTGAPRPSTDDKTEYPVVEFENGDSCLCPPLSFTVVNVFGRVEASRDQVRQLVRLSLSTTRSDQNHDPPLLGSPHHWMGNDYSQESRTDFGPSQS